MSTGPESSNGDTAREEEVVGEGAYDDRTPKSEVPITVKVLSPSTSSESTIHQSLEGSSDYFSQPGGTATTEASQSLAAALHSRPSSVTPANANAAITGESDATATGELQLPDTAPSLLSPRPTAQSHLSSLSTESAESAATIRPHNNAIWVPTPQAFPEQSLASLQKHKYPVRPHPPPVLRQRSSHPGHIHTWTSAFASAHNTGTRTAGNSPAVTPGVGLFSPNTEPPTDDYESPETPGTYASPFLHFTHRQAPKETHVADVDVDPISGRKLINHYEIIDELGRGTHGKVKLGRDLQTENTYVAIKIVERYSKKRKLGKLVSAAEDKVKKEVAILKKARHPNVVALLEVIDDPTRKKVYIVLEWVERGEIQWRVKTRKEIAMVEARRYERERSGRSNAQTAAEDEAVMLEAQRRLAKEKRRILREDRRRVRHMLKEQSEDPVSWSHELAGDELSEDSEDDRLSRISTSTTMDSHIGNRLFAESRRASRTPSPLPPIADDVSPKIQRYLPMTMEEQTLSPINTASHNILAHTGLEGTMYGPYSPNSSNSSRVNSLAHSSIDETVATPAELQALAVEILDSELNPELEYCPLLTMQQARIAFRDTLLGLQYLHVQGIIHRDIKPPNLLQTNEHRVKISDFGVSYLGRPMQDDERGEEVSEHDARDFDEAKELAKTVGTPAFYAPELCYTEPLEGNYTPPVTKAIDVWALGITLFCMLFARTPFVDSEFVVMRQIADEEVYVPRKRLMPVNTKPSSRPSSHSRAFPPQATGKRNEFDIQYEAVDDDLYDLLKRMLTKDPLKRMTLEEVRHHPWVVADLSNKLKWLEETDPGQKAQGKKIEVSNEDVKAAVVPLQFLERVRSGIKKVTDRLGLGTTKPRGRTSSNAGLTSQTTSPAASAGSSSSTLNQDHRRQSLRGDEDIYTALKASRHGEKHGEHPLSRSVAASPELDRSTNYFESADAQLQGGRASPDLELHPTPSRPSPPERAKTTMSTADSIRTLKQSDVYRGRESPPPSPGLPGTPMALQSLGGSGLSNILGGGLARQTLKGLRERSTPRGPDIRGRSMDRESLDSFSAHGEPSIALSQTSVEGHVNPPEALQELERAASRPSSIQNSPAGSRSTSVVGSPINHLQPFPGFPGLLSRNSSGGSIRSLSRVAEEEMTRSPQLSRHPAESSAEEWQRADDERIRKLIRQGKEESERPPSAFDDRTCPPSPDDQRAKRRESGRMSAADLSAPVSSHETSPTGYMAHLPPAMVSSSSDFGSAVSMSISNPSIPSVISEATSADPTEGAPIQELDAKRNDSSGDTLNPMPPLFEDHMDEGYSPDRDQALDSDNDDEYDSSSDSDGGLVMGRRKSKVSKPVTAGEQLAAALGETDKSRRNTGLSTRSKKSSRSGSNNTMKKVRTRDSDEDRRRRSCDLTEE